MGRDGRRRSRAKEGIVGAFALGEVCERCEAGQESLEAVKTALDVALLDIAAYAHEQALRSLKG